MDLKRDARYEPTAAIQAAATAACRRQLAAWGITPPPVEALVRDFGTGDFYRVGEIEFWIANEVEAGYCGKYLFVFADQTCPYHHHEHKHETFFILKGQVAFRREEGTTTQGPGDRIVVPPFCKHAFTGVGPALILEISTPALRGDSHFAELDMPAF